MSYNLKTLAKIWRDGNNRGNKIGITALGKYGNYAIPVPAGLIVPLNDTSIPNGWSAFTSANDKLLVGAGSSYSPGATGGSTIATSAQVSGSGGNHDGPTSNKWFISTYQSGSYNGFDAGGTYAGEHTHSIQVDYLPLSQNTVLIKANEQLTELPAKAVVLGNGSIDNVDNIFTSGSYLRASSSIGTTSSNTLTMTTAGAHAHNTYTNWRYTDSSAQTAYSDVSAGSHSSDHSVSVTESIKKARLSAWTKAASAFPLAPNMIGMYESVTPPSGWVLCNGSNGTPDLRDYFIQTVATGNEAAGSGNNTISWTGLSTTYHYGHHNHIGSSIGLNNSGSLLHTQHQWYHGHFISSQSGRPYLPPYYALAFIMKS